VFSCLRGFLERQAEAIRHLAPAESGDGKSPAVEVLRHPFLFECDLQQSCSESAADMRPPLAPVQAGACEASAKGAGCLNINAQICKSPDTDRCDLVSTIVF
jgi:hypothetical protein